MIKTLYDILKDLTKIFIKIIKKCKGRNGGKITIAQAVAEWRWKLTEGKDKRKVHALEVR